MFDTTKSNEAVLTDIVQLFGCQKVPGNQNIDWKNAYSWCHLIIKKANITC